MRAVGIIAEYNPFHNGHKWHVDKARGLSDTPYVVAVMSGNFVQRGEAALFDKWKRAEMAVLAGVDLVLELPVVFAVRSAQHFAAGGIRLLNALGIVSHICFGTEEDNLSLLSRLAAAGNQSTTTAALKQNLKTGMTYAAAFSRALATECEHLPEILSSPNNILAVEYLRAIQTYAPDLTPLAVRRQQAGYHEEAITVPYASATAIRREIVKAMEINDTLTKVLPAASVEIIRDLLNTQRGPFLHSALELMLLSKLRTSSLSTLETLPDVGEGLQHKILAAAMKTACLEELLTIVKSKRYTRTRLQRILIHALLGTTKQQLAEFDKSGPLYARILAFNNRGRLLLSHIQAKADIPVITKTTQFLTGKQRSSERYNPLQNMLRYDTVASDLYVLGYPNPCWRLGCQDFLRSPLYIPQHS